MMADIEEGIKRLSIGDVAVVGVPLDENSSFLKGAAMAPDKIREALNEGSSNMSTELGLDLAANKNWHDLGNLQLGTGDEAFAKIEQTVTMILARGARILALGGDHAITYPSAKPFAQAFRGLTVLDFDAHPDLYDDYQGNKRSHASPFARLMEQDESIRLIQVGIRAANEHQRQQAKRFGVKMFEMKDWPPARMPQIRGKVYISLDLDGLDPAFAPGVSHHEAGGLSARDVLHVLHGLRGTEIVGADIVELNPRRDLNGVTARVASKFYKELVGLMLEQPGKRFKA